MLPILFSSLLTHTCQQDILCTPNTDAGLFPSFVASQTLGPRPARLAFGKERNPTKFAHRPNVWWCFFFFGASSILGIAHAKGSSPDKHLIAQGSVVSQIQMSGVKVRFAVSTNICQAELLASGLFVCTIRTARAHTAAQLLLCSNEDGNRDTFKVQRNNHTRLRKYFHHWASSVHKEMFFSCQTPFPKTSQEHCLSGRPPTGH